MTFEELGGLGEFVGALAVLASLIYVARQIHQNTKATRLATFQAGFDASQSIFDAAARDAELARILRIGLADPSKLTEDEYARLFWWVFLALRLAENGFFQHQAGAVDDDTWKARSRGYENLLASPTVNAIWKTLSPTFRGDFQDWVSSRAPRKPITLWPPPAA